MAKAVVDPEAFSAVEVGLGIRDAAEMLNFYQNVLGFVAHGEIPMAHGHIYGLERGGVLLKLLHLNETPEARNPAGRATGFRYITLRVRELDALYESCLAAGASVVMPKAHFTTAQGAEVDFAMIADPEGNWLELVQGNAWVPHAATFRPS